MSAKKEAGLDTDKKYRAFLKKIAGVSSSKDLTEDQAAAVIEAMGGLNRKPRETKAKKKIEIPSVLRLRLGIGRMLRKNNGKIRA